MDKGRFDEAIAAYREALRLKKDLVVARANLAVALRFKAALEKLPRILKGTAGTADAAECLVLAWLCQMPGQKLHAASARFSQQAFAAQPALAANLQTGARYNAACAAALAGCGQGNDGAVLTPMQRLYWRRQALTWLRADLRARARQLESGWPGQAQQARQALLYWLPDAAFNGVRGAQALGRLPAEERAAWVRLWADVADLLGPTKAPLTPGMEKPTRP